MCIIFVFCYNVVYSRVRACLTHFNWQKICEHHSLYTFCHLILIGKMSNTTKPADEQFQSEEALSYPSKKILNWLILRMRTR